MVTGMTIVVCDLRIQGSLAGCLMIQADQTVAGTNLVKQRKRTGSRCPGQQTGCLVLVADLHRHQVYQHGKRQQPGRKSAGKAAAGKMG